jgi:hypothetical protein
MSRLHQPLRQRRPRVENPAYLRWLRAQGCACGCGSPPPSEAAHIRHGSVAHDKSYTGMGEKPDDKWAVPLKRQHHAEQHLFGSERLWWSLHGLDACEVAVRCHRRYAKATGKAVDAPSKVRGTGKPAARKNAPRAAAKASTHARWDNFNRDKPKRAWPKRKFPNRNRSPK